MSDKEKNLSEAISQIEKQFGKGTVMKMGDREVVDIPSVSTGSIGLDIALGISIFVIIIFIILMINKGIGRAVSYSGIGTLDKIFGFFFGFLRAYVISVCIFATIDIIYNHKKWPINLDHSYSFPYVLKGSNYLIKEFPNEKDYQDTKEKVQEL